jgi:hypothetical protein
MHAAVNGDYAKVRDCVHLCEAGACGKQQPAPDDEERVNAFHASLSGRGDGFINYSKSTVARELVKCDLLPT